MFEKNLYWTIQLFAVVIITAVIGLAGYAAGASSSKGAHKAQSASGKTPAVEHPMKTPKMYSKVKRCSNCGMMINMWARTRHVCKHPEGDFTFCSIRCVADKEKNSGQPVTDVHVALYLHPDKMIPADQAAYVIGSNAKGTMTMRSKIAFENKALAAQFAVTYGGVVTDFAGALKAAAMELTTSAPMIDQRRKRTGKIKAVTKDTVCVVCNMKVVNYPGHDCQILLQDNSSIHFCSTHCLIHYLNDPGQYVKKPKAVKMTWAKVFPTGDYESAIGLYYVVASKRLGPMGREAFPFRSKKAADALVLKEGGNIVNFKGLTPQMVSNQ